jgi:predicted house-cleaning NTP pyrophosphatase (Maf/HAM1 superfamily)
LLCDCSRQTRFPPAAVVRTVDCPGFDTIVVHRDRILEKPADAAEAETMVRVYRKSGETTVVYTAIAAAVSQPRIIEEAIDVAKVTMTRDLTEHELRKYLADPGYIEASGALIVEILQEFEAVVLDGEVSSVMGFSQTAVSNVVASLRSRI